MNSFGQITQHLRLLWNGMTPARRVGTIVILATAMACVLGIGYWASQPDYRVLFSGLAAEDAGAIVAKLQAKNIPHRLEAAGTTILVPVEQVQATRVALATEDLPSKGGRGFEMFDQNSYGMSPPFVQHLNHLRALQAELARSIVQIDPIVQARVHLVRPEPTPFVRDQKPATASVVVRLKTGAVMPRQAVAAVVALVCRSVEGLARENISIVDSQGRLLTEERDAETGGNGSAMDQRREMEQYLSTRAESMLMQAVGPGRAVVRVTAEVKSQRLKEQKVTYSPEGRVATKETVKSTKSTGAAGGSGARGAAGTSANLVRLSGDTASASGTNTQETIDTDYLVSKTLQEFEDKAGAIERLSIAVLVDLTPEERQGKSQAAMTLVEVEDIIKRAVGFKTGRDDIKVSQVRLAPADAGSLPDTEWETLQRWTTITTLVRHSSLGVAALASLMMGWLLLRRQRSAAPAPAAVTEPSPPVPNAALLRLAETAEKDPDALARVLAQWLEKPERPQRQAA